MNLPTVVSILESKDFLSLIDLTLRIIPFGEHAFDHSRVDERVFERDGALRQDLVFRYVVRPQR